jgi:hypothetical protein
MTKKVEDSEYPWLLMQRKMPESQFMLILIHLEIIKVFYQIMIILLLEKVLIIPPVTNNNTC